MIVLDAKQVAVCLPWDRLIAAIAQGLRDADIEAPQRLAVEMRGRDADAAGTLLVMPSWKSDELVGIKIVTVWPDNARHGVPTHASNYVLMGARSGEILALLDGAELTARRTAAVSVVAATNLMRADASRLLIIGTGPIAQYLAIAHAASHAFETIEIHGRNLARASRLVAQLQQEGVACSCCQDLQSSVRQADMICTATAASTPLFDGRWLRPGVHLDLVGSFRRDMRECDDHVMRSASAIWVDTLAAIDESGDLILPLESGVIDQTAVRGDLRALLARATGSLRTSTDITVFKSVGFAIPDLIAAGTALQNFNASKK